jgi:hypothetical protein
MSTYEQDSEKAFERLMDAHQTLIQLKVGDVVTQQTLDDLLLIDADYRENDERNTDAFHRGYDVGLTRGAGADTAKLIEERDSARISASLANALRTSGEYHAFRQGAQMGREMAARFVEQGGHPVIAQSIRLNWRQAWGDDPGAPEDEIYAAAAPCKISAKPLDTAQVSA